MRDREHQARGGEAPAQGITKLPTPPAFTNGVLLAEIERGTYTRLRVLHGVLNGRQVCQVHLVFRHPSGEWVTDRRRAINIRREELRMVFDALREAMQAMGLDDDGGRNGQ